MKNFWLILFVVGIITTVFVSALPTVEQLKINGDVFETGDTLVVERGETLDIKVKLQAENVEKNIEGDAVILGYEYNDHESISDSTHLFDMEAGDTVYKTMQIKVPEKTEKDFYDLRIRFGTRTEDAFEGRYRLHIVESRHDVVIKDVVLSPEGTVKSGRALLAIVRVKNMGAKDEDGIKIKVSIPDLGISGSEYIDELKAGESTSSEEIYLKIPTCVASGSYAVKASIEYDESYEESTYTTEIDIVEEDVCKAKATTVEEKTEIMIGAVSQSVKRGGAGAVYPITIKNAGNSAQTYIVSVAGVDDWASVQISPSAVFIVQPGELKSAYVYLSPRENAAEGEHVFSIKVGSAGEEKQIPVSVVVSGKPANSWTNVKRGLEIAGIVLVVLLVILGIILALNRLGGKEHKEEENQTYY
ncbi:MAG: hypothetical protein NTV63_04105 [Candidatus Woesearchaeota archaeon]|nr:hypothetical protein [Candidatus Woesearchaeota archaeon]